MNVLDYSIRLGKLLRKTEEGRELYQLEMNIEKKYIGNNEFHKYEEFAEKNTSQLYFYSWDMAYKAFINVLTDDSINHRESFVPTAELVSSDDEIKRLASTGVSFGHLFDKIVATIISGGRKSSTIPGSWKYKVRNAISDVQIAVERTLLIRTITLYYQKNKELLKNDATNKYLTEREEKKFLPFSESAFNMMKEAKDVPDEEKILYEKLFLIMEAVKKGIFYGFWGMVNEISEEELLTEERLIYSPLSEVTITVKNSYSSLFGHGWLYKIYMENEYMYFMAHRKKVEFSKDNEKSTISGIIYPSDDRRLFEKTGLSYKDTDVNYEKGNTKLPDND